MRHLLCIAAAIALATGCSPDAVPNPPPTDGFYFPTGIATATSGADAGLLFVASSNFDKRFDRGLMSLVDLTQVTSADGQHLPPLGAAPYGALPLQLQNLALNDSQTLQIQSLAGEIALFQTTDFIRAFVPSRAEGAPLQFMDAVGTQLVCPYATDRAPKDCYSNAPSLIARENTKTGVPRAPAPYGVTVFNDTADPANAELFLTHLQNADSPPNEQTNYRSYLVRSSALNPEIIESDAAGGSFVNLGLGGTNSVAVTHRWAFVSGRYQSDGAGNAITELLRLVDRQNDENVVHPAIESDFRSTEARGIALTQNTVFENSKRMYLVGRTPDTLLVADVNGLLGDSPTIKIVHQQPLPAQPNELRLIERPGRRPLVVISCTGAETVVIYDDETSTIVAQVTGVGIQPYGVAVRTEQSTLGVLGARIFTSNFGDGRVAVIDIDDLNQPYNARVVAHLGSKCVTRPEDPSCTSGAAK